MIEFSLREGLIERYRPGMAPSQIEDEVRQFSSEVDAYRSLPVAAASIAGLIESGRYRLFGERPLA